MKGRINGTKRGIIDIDANNLESIKTESVKTETIKTIMTFVFMPFALKCGLEYSVVLGGKSPDTSSGK